MIKKILNILVIHGAIVLGIVFLIFLKLDGVNPAMKFISSPQGRFLLLIFCVFSLINALKAAVALHKTRIKKWKEFSAEREKQTNSAE